MSYVVNVDIRVHCTMTKRVFGIVIRHKQVVLMRQWRYHRKTFALEVLTAQGCTSVRWCDVELYERILGAHEVRIIVMSAIVAISPIDRA